jgi:hypothetical protein
MTPYVVVLAWAFALTVWRWVVLGVPGAGSLELRVAIEQPCSSASVARRLHHYYADDDGRFASEYVEVRHGDGRREWLRTG